MDGGVSGDIVFQIQGFEIRKKREDTLPNIAHHRRHIVSGVVEEEVATMSDHIARDREEHGDHRWDKCWEKENECQEWEELQDDTENGWSKEWIEWNRSEREHDEEDDRLESNHEEHHESESEKFPDDDTPSSDRLREHEIDCPTLDLASDHTTTEEEDDGETGELDEWEAEVIEHTLDLTEGKGLERKGDEDEDHSEKKDQWEKSISHEFADSIESNSEHMNQ